MQRRLKRFEMSDAAVGLVAIGVVAVLAAVAAYFYLSPPNERTVTFTTRDAVSLRGGEDVRVAGISVGKVKDVVLASDDNNVTVSMSVKSDVHLGDDARVQVRLLTAVGGFFVALEPGGADVVRNAVTIPIERVSVPYTIADTLQDLPRVTDNVAGAPIDDILKEIDKGVGDNPGALRNVVDGMQSLATILDRQRAQITTTLDLTNEYLSTFNQSKEFVFGLLRKVNIVLSTHYTYRAGFSKAFEQLGGVLLRLGALAKFYVNHKEQIGTIVGRVRDGAGKLRDGMDGLIDNLAPLQSTLSAFATSAGQQKDPNEIDGAAICLPVAGKAC